MPQKKVGKVLLRAGVIYAVKACTAGAVDAKGAAEAIEDAAGNAADKILEEVLTSRESDRGKMNAFQATLSELPALLGKEALDEKGNPKPPKPLIFIIDELDRCRPTFALEVLERIKHFFSVPNVHFVLGVNIEQLENSIKAAYGADIAAKTYLQKFIALTVELDVQPGLDRHIDNRVKFLAYLEKQMEFQPKDREILDALRSVVCAYAKKHGLSLRHLERIISLVAITLAYTENNILRLPSIIAGLCIMKVMAPRLFRNAKDGRLTYSEVERFFGWRSDDAPESVRSERVFKDWWRYCLDESVDSDIVERCRDATFRYDVDEPRDIIRFSANNIIDRFVMAR